ncbi:MULTISPECIES: relaxase/mobilization nuclease domain-containing protein [Microbacterium]|jgi:hypothetical protein|uniref:relaxase/mobilization nuclease domain-containing protein n=1 Tax=Microbacterium TaxID=33882 RepID=UPI00049351AD|nr:MULTISPECIES: relaxase/mobilization nuclease domain-containing protein [Microbacterium]AVL96159.1 hypothetical protein C6C15_03025 [Microbacterium sp. str. 'China']KYJ98122.1 hypothetical protein AUV07_12630 [Microbacterium sp. CH1]MCT1394456.1 relaxase/mobilization nuclease domain-containing protein [Microbacterium sp. p3-SID338]MDH5132026.1 relaxase/mobilization nuclease domain-containing protein [Microbacterium sp. RD10]MDH5135711.1 relaxase/mobilization nuclease domain-containing protei
MPVVVASSTRSADALINYALDDKPEQDGERYVMASGVGGMLVSVAKQQMRDVRKKWGKDKPGAFVQAYHVIQSFAKDELDPEEPDDWLTAQKLGTALAEERFPGRQVLVVTQRDGRTGCVHNHLVANSIETKTGRSLNSSVVTHARLVEAHERVLEQRGFEQRADLKQAFSDANERFERGEPSGLRRAGSTADSELREWQRHIIWETECDLADEFGAPRNKQPFSLTVLRASIENTLADPAVVDWDSFVEVGRTRGVQIEQRGKKGRGISYGMLRENPDRTPADPTPSDRRRCTTLGTAFERDAVETAFARNSAVTLSVPQHTTVERRLSPKKRMMIALDEATQEANRAAQRLVATALSNADAMTSEHENSGAHAPTELPAVPGTMGLSELRETQPRIADPEEPETEVTVPDYRPHDVEQPRSARPQANTGENQETSPKPRPLRLRFPALFEEAELSAPDHQERSIGD